MADTDVVTALLSFSGQAYNSTTVQVGNQVWFFYVDSGSDLAYVRTADISATTPTWDSPVIVRAGRVLAFGIWFDQWTPGDSGTIVHIAYLDSTANDVFYRKLDTSDNSLGTEDADLVSESGITITDVLSPLVHLRGDISITKSAASTPFVHIAGDPAAGASEQFHIKQSTGDWVSAGALFHEVAGSSAVDRCIIFPGNEADKNDIFGFYIDASANSAEIKQYDASVPSVAQIHSLAGLTENSSGSEASICIDQNNKHAYIAFWNATDSTSADLLFYDMTSAATIGSVVTVISNLAESGNAHMTHDPTNDRLYLFYVNGSAGAWFSNSLGVYRFSDNNGVSWSAEQAYTEDANDGVFKLNGSMVINPSGAGATLMPLWFDLVDNDIMENLNNEITIAAAGGGGLSIPVAMHHYTKNIGSAA